MAQTPVLKVVNDFLDEAVQSLVARGWRRAFVRMRVPEETRVAVLLPSSVPPAGAPREQRASMIMSIMYVPTDDLADAAQAARIAHVFTQTYHNVAEDCRLIAVPTVCENGQSVDISFFYRPKDE